MARRWTRPTNPAEPVFYSGSSGAVLGTLSERKAQTKMRMIGTGKDPEGRYPEGLVFDTPDVDPSLRPQGDYLVEQGYATVMEDPALDPGRTERQIAESVVRGDPLTDPVDQAIAEKIGGDALSMVHEDSEEVVLNGSGSGFSDEQPSGNLDQPEAANTESAKNAGDAKAASDAGKRKASGSGE